MIGASVSVSVNVGDVDVNGGSPLLGARDRIVVGEREGCAHASIAGLSLGTIS